MSGKRFLRLRLSPSTVLIFFNTIAVIGESNLPVLTLIETALICTFVVHLDVSVREQT